VIDVHRERIGEMLKTNTVTTVHQRLRDEQGLAVSITSLRRYVWLQFPDHADAERVTCCARRSRPGRRPRSTGGSWATGSIPSRTGCGECGPS
jgi:hypothetical protein